MTRGKGVSPDHTQFFSDIAAVMEKHKDVAANFMLAHVQDRSLLGDAPAGEDDCLVWAIDPRTNQRYCIQYRGQ